MGPKAESIAIIEYADADDAVARAATGASVILVRKETNPDDIHGLLARSS